MALFWTFQRPYNTLMDLTKEKRNGKAKQRFCKNNGLLEREVW